MPKIPDTYKRKEPTKPVQQELPGLGAGPVAASGLAARLRASEAKTKAGPSDKSPHLVVLALAGTGKTTTLIEGLHEMRGHKSKFTPSPQQKAVWDSMALSRSCHSVGFCAFNTKIADVLRARVPQGCDAMTTHGMGNRTVRRAFGFLRDPNRDRVQEIIADLLHSDPRTLRREQPLILKSVDELVKLCKVNLVGLKDSLGVVHPDGLLCEYEDLARFYDVDLGEDSDAATILQLVPEVLERCKDVNRDRCIDFNDMIWLPIVLGLDFYKYDVLLVDEAQDLNRCQQLMIRRAAHRLILCGDEHQSVYGFTGADADSIPRMIRVLKSTDRGCDVLPLTVTRRCGKAIVQEARRHVPAFEAHETNGPGLVTKRKFAGKVTFDQKDMGYRSLVQPTDMILCRVNAPLVSECMRFIKEGKTAVIQGRDVGRNLVTLIKKYWTSTLEDFIAKVTDWAAAEIAKENAKRNPSEDRILSIQDKCDCLVALTEGTNSLNQMEQKVLDMFTDDKIETAINLSSVHKAKGLEAKRVFILQPKGATMPMRTRSDWQRQQELNLIYVAITRAIEELVWVMP
jgi:superfamily I DNA/RNA helicase